MRILVDQDEVLADFVNPLLQKWFEHTGIRLTRDQVQGWDISTLLGGNKRWLRETISHPDYFADLPPKEGAIKGFHALENMGHELFIVTHVSDDVTNAFEGKRECVRRHLPGFHFNKLSFFTCKELIDAHVLIDNGPHNIKAWSDAGRHGGIIFDAPWNRTVNENNFARSRTSDSLNAYRALDWGQVLYWVKQINDERELEHRRAEHGICA